MARGRFWILDFEFGEVRGQRAGRRDARTGRAVLCLVGINVIFGVISAMPGGGGFAGFATLRKASRYVEEIILFSGVNRLFLNLFYFFILARTGDSGFFVRLRHYTKV